MEEMHCEGVGKGTRDPMPPDQSLLPHLHLLSKQGALPTLPPGCL